MKTYFQSQKLWEIVEEGVTLPEDSSTSSSAEKGKLENKKAKDSEALYYIQTAVADHIFPRISVATSAKKAWSILQKEYQGSAKVRIIKLQTLRRDFENMKMKDSETIDEYYTKVRELVNQLKAYGEDIPEKKVVEKLLISVTEKYDPIVTTIEETKDITTLTVTELVGSLEAYEKRRSRREENSLENAFQSKLNMSVGQMMEKGYTLQFGGDSCTIYDNKDKTLIIAKTYHKSKLSREPVKPVCKEKQHKRPFPSGTSWRAKAVLELIHTDVCGPMRTPSHEQNRYFILFIDDYSRMTWVYFMREKSEVFKIFKKLKNLVEKQSGQRIKVLRSDRGKEYNNSEFDKFCEEEGIDHQTTVSYNPQQNGVSERKNRTIMEMARSMLQEKHLPKAFWAEAVYTAVYLLNRCPTKAVQNMTPIEAWSGRKPSAKHLRVFGSICYVHIPTEKRHKLEEKTEKGIFLGYSTQSKGYRIYNLKTKKLIISRDVEFDEDAMWNWDEEKVERQTVMIPKETPPQHKRRRRHRPNRYGEEEPTST
ncbi:UNVERIFIED_CONTAM: Retrovirus-related Pol polyprotein from transposon TNT 1-94 [Sesamum radiatum]|uniref:Retrovirus-related Pol polyprotein from transposon TNT 1-94 n=1 Tax=Sesamum radiatum TaxID=300843 RepID=A0AAW2R760_SESRA